MNKIQHATSHGFTLLEILIAVIIFAVVMTILFSSFNAFILSSETIKQELARSEAIKQTFKRIRLDIESIYIQLPPQYSKPDFNSAPDPFRFLGQETQIDHQTVSIMSFTSFAALHLTNQDPSPLSKVSYSVVMNNKNTYDLVRSEQAPLAEDSLPPCPNPVLCTGMADFDLSYTAVDGETYSYWDSESDQFRYSTPKSITIQVVFGTREQQTRYETTIRLMSGREPIQ